MAGLLCVLAFGPAAAQSLDPSTVVAISARPHAPSPRPLRTHPTDECALYLGGSGTALELTLAGQRVFDVVAGVPGDPTCNARAEGLLRDALEGDYDRLALALPVHRQESGARDFARFLAVLTDRRGPARSVRALGTMAEAGDAAATYVRVRFDQGDELLRVKWRGDHLALVTRGVLPHVRAHPLQFGAYSGGLRQPTRPDEGACLLWLDAAETATESPTVRPGERE